MKHYFDSGIEWEMADEARTAGEIRDETDPEDVEPNEPEDEEEEEDMEEIYRDAVFG